MLRLASLILCVLSLGSCGQAGKPDPTTVADERNDAKFSEPYEEKESHILVKEATFYLQEMKLCKLAQENSINNGIRITGKVLEKEYSQSYALLKDLAAVKDISIPTEPDNERQKKNKRLSFEIAEDFDNKFLELIIDDHRQALARHKNAMTLVRDPEIVALLDKSRKDILRNLDFILLRHPELLKKSG